MIIIDDLSNNLFFFIKPFVMMGFKIYYLKSSKSKEFNQANLKPLTFKRKSINGYELIHKWSIGDKEYINSYINKYLPIKSEKYLEGLFKGIKDIRTKIILAFLSDIKFHEIGSINIHFCLNKVDNERLFLIHTSIKSYLLKTNASSFDYPVCHCYLPFDDLVKILKLLSKIPNIILNKRLIKNFFKRNNHKIENNFIKIKKQKKIGLIVHDSFYYGNGLFKKDHYFSNDINSPLHPDNMDIFIHNEENSKLLKNLKGVKKLKVSITFKSIKKSIIKFLNSCYLVNNINELYGLLFSLLIYIKYNAWINYFKNQNNSHIIYDYDVLISKSLSMAIEKLGIKSIAIQERPVISQMHTYGLIVDTYLVTSKFYEDFCRDNKLFLVKEFFNFGMWRLSFFYKSDLVKLKNTEFYSPKNLKINNFKYKIVIIGLYIDFDNNMPDTNLESFSDFIKNSKKIADTFHDAAVIIRMKNLSKKESKYIKKHISNNRNIFLSTDYENYMVSYSLCKASDLIISTCCTLADECLAFGKKVIFFNNLYPIKNMALETYPQEFHFCIPLTIDELITMIIKCLQNDRELNNKYIKLQNLLSGEIDFSKPHVISKTLESLLDKN